MILHKNETVIRVRKKHCDVGSGMYYLKFTHDIPERQFFFTIPLQIFSNLTKLSDCFFSHWITLENLELYHSIQQHDYDNSRRDNVT